MAGVPFKFRGGCLALLVGEGCGRQVTLHALAATHPASPSDSGAGAHD